MKGDTLGGMTRDEGQGTPADATALLLANLLDGPVRIPWGVERKREFQVIGRRGCEGAIRLTDARAPIGGDISLQRDDRDCTRSEDGDIPIL